MNPDPAPCGTSSVLPNLVDAMVEVVCEDDRRMSYEHVCLKLKMRVCAGVCMYVCMYVEVRMTDVTTVVVVIRNATVKMISTVAQVVYNGNDGKSVQAKMAGQCGVAICVMKTHRFGLPVTTFVTNKTDLDADSNILIVRLSSSSSPSLSMPAVEYATGSGSIPPRRCCPPRVTSLWQYSASAPALIAETTLATTAPVDAV